MNRSIRWRASRRRLVLQTGSQASQGSQAFQAVFSLRWWLNLKLWLILIAFLLLSGCVRYDVGINFVDANHGTMVQHIRLDDQITGISQATVKIWLNQLVTQTQQLGGQIQHPSEQELVLTIPFYNAKDLSRKFDQFFQALTDAGLPEQRSDQRLAKSGSVPISRFQIQTRNFLLWQRHRITYDLDLRSLSLIPTITPTKAFVIEPTDLLKLELTLNTPWGAQSDPLDNYRAALPNSLTPEFLLPTVQRQGKRLVWSLKPGKINHLEADFALPSPLGIGAVVIVIAVLTGMLLRAWQYPSSLIDYP